MNIGIFCSANHDIDRDFFTLTHEFGEWAAKEGHTIVYGGCNMGLMECVAHAAFNAGGRTIGVVPRIVETHGKASDYSTVTIPCDNLSDRKDLLMLHSDVFVALPGGIGTLDEVFTVVASSTIGYHEKKVILYNMKGFWNGLIACLDDLHEKGVTRKQWRTYIQVANSLEELITLLNSTITITTTGTLHL